MPWTRMIDRLLASQRWLDPTGAWIQKLVTAIFSGLGGGGRALKGILNGTWLGHQLHPLITDVPLGAWTVAVLFDLAAIIVRPTHTVEVAAFWIILVGWVAALGAFLTGWTEFADTADRETRYGVAHGLLNTVAIVLYGLSLVIRLTGPQGLAVGLALAGYVVVISAAYLGGELVFNIGYAINHHAFQSPPTDWAPALPVAQLAEGKLTQAWVQGVNVLLYRHGSTISAISATCSHAGGPLAEGTVLGNAVICPWHASRFDLVTGAVRGSPATINAVRYDVRIQNGRIEVKRSAETLQPN
jgi:nitrite reductase/ring-hydroxylating ferredoxin subunit/uncharacterized membrane protein